MAMISGFGGITPPDRSKASAGPKQTEANVDPQVGNDGVEFNFQAGEPLKDPNAWYDSKTSTVNFKDEATPHNQEVAKPGPSPALDTRSNSVPVTLTMDDGLFGVNSVSSGTGVEKTGLGAFTNGLGSTSLIGLSGRELASLNPLKSQQ